MGCKDCDKDASREEKCDRTRQELLDDAREGAKGSPRYLTDDNGLCSVETGGCGHVIGQHTNGATEPQESKSLFSHGIPVLTAPVVISSSAPSVPPSTEHLPCREQKGTLVTVDVIPPRKRDTIPWQLKADNRWRYGSESDVGDRVVAVLTGILDSLGLSDLSLAKELGTHSVRPDIWVLHAKGVPIGVVEVKKMDPTGRTDVLHAPNVVGELFDYMQHLPNFYGLSAVFGILTTLDKWRFAWLNNDGSRSLAAEEITLDIQDDAHTAAVSTPTKATRNTLPDSPPFSPSKASPQTRPLPELEEEMEVAQSSSDEGTRTKAEYRTLFITREYSCQQDGVGLVQKIAGCLLKMRKAYERYWTRWDDSFHNWQQRSFLVVHKCDELLPYTWGTLPSSFNPAWGRYPRADAQTLYLVEDLGEGRDGRTWLACTASGAICVIKFMKGHNNEAAADHEKTAWHAVYPWTKTQVRASKWGGRPAVVMPHFADLTRAERKDVFRKDGEWRKRILQALQGFQDRGWKYTDLKFANIGKYSNGTGEDRVVVYDMTSAHENEEGDCGWMESEMAKLGNPS